MNYKIDPLTNNNYLYGSLSVRRILEMFIEGVAWSVIRSRLPLNMMCIFASNSCSLIQISSFIEYMKFTDFYELARQS